jgi:UPF0755 protein
MSDSTIDTELEDEYWDDEDWDDDDYVFVPEDRGIGRKFAYVGVCFVLIIVVVLGGAGYWLMNQINPSGSGTGEPVTLVIPNDAGLATISRLLEEKEIVSNATIFRYYAKWKDIDTVRAGEYDRLYTNQSMDDVITRLNQGPIPPKFSEVTFPEGMWLTETALTAITAYPEMDPFEFSGVLTSPDTPRSRYQPEGAPFDGFLFPATYRVEDPDRADEQKLVDQMVKQFDTVGQEIGLDNATAMLEGQAGNREITPYDAVIVASLIEGEANRPEERAKVARVIYNRLKRDMILGLDATVPFALGEKKEELTKSDLDIDSPFNLRKFKGLTPTPINSPGKDSLVAALNPSTEEGSDGWLYYVLISKDGTHLFTDDYNEFLAAGDKARAEGVF